MQKNESKKMIIAAIVYASISVLFGFVGIWLVFYTRDEKYIKNPSNIAPLIYDSTGSFLAWTLVWPFMLVYQIYLLITNQNLPGDGST